MKDFLKAITTIIGGMALVFGAIFLAALMSTAGGILVGWVVSLIFDDMILKTIARFGVNISGLTMVQLGGTLGFIGAFFRNVNNPKSSKSKEK